VSDPDADVSVKLQRPTADRDAESSAKERKRFNHLFFSPPAEADGLGKPILQAIPLITQSTPASSQAHAGRGGHGASGARRLGG
jgi:hypothetical protein